MTFSTITDSKIHTISTYNTVSNTTEKNSRLSGMTGTRAHGINICCMNMTRDLKQSTDNQEYSVLY